MLQFIGHDTAGGISDIVYEGEITLKHVNYFQIQNGLKD